MFEADAEMSKLKYLPGIDDMTERYRTHVQGVAESYRTAGLTNASKKEEEVRGKREERRAEKQGVCTFCGRGGEEKKPGRVI